MGCDPPHPPPSITPLRMDVIQSILNSTLFAEKFPHSAPQATNEDARLIQMAFWDDAYNRNLRLEHVEVELRVGKCPIGVRGPFSTSVPRKQFGKMLESLQGYTGWDSVTHETDVVSYFPQMDDSIRVVTREDGSTMAITKQRVCQADFVGHDLPFDLRLSVSVEIALDSSVYNVEKSTRSVVRRRSSFTLKNIRYDLTEVLCNGVSDYQVEIELINLPTLQLQETNAQVVAMELQQATASLMNALEPVRSFNISLLRRRNF